MTDKNEKVESGFEPSTVESNENSSHVNNYIITGLATIIAITALLTGFYTMQLHKQLNNQMRSGDDHLSAQLDELKQTQNDVTSKTNQFNQTEQQLQQQFANLQKELHAIAKEKGHQNQDWLLLKAHYYLELAQMDNFWSTDFKTTIALLNNADSLLQQLNQSKVVDIRKAIAKEIALINSTPIVDVPGLLSTLDALQITIDNLKLPARNALAKTSKANVDSTSWKSRLENSANWLGKLIVVRRDNEQIKPLLSPLMETMLKESVRLNIQEAQWAVLNKNTKVYQWSLNQAISNVKRNFDEQNQTTADLLQQLQTLEKTNVNQEKPKLGLALPLLEQLIEANELGSDKKGGNGQ